MKEIGSDPYNRVSASDDITKRKHGGSDTSIRAWERMRHNQIKSQMAVLQTLEDAWPLGLTAKEISRIMEKPFNAMSGRCTELLEQDLIYKTDERRGGGRVLKLSYVPAGLPWGQETATPPVAGPVLPQNSRNAFKEQITKLVESDDLVAALNLSLLHNIGMRLELEGVTV